jgi:hypothetical protein
MVGSLSLPRFLACFSLFRAHAKAGGAARISGYLGTSDVFDTAIRRYAIAYADQARVSEGGPSIASRRSGGRSEGGSVAAVTRGEWVGSKAAGI